MAYSLWFLLLIVSHLKNVEVRFSGSALTPSPSLFQTRQSVTSSLAAGPSRFVIAAFPVLRAVRYAHARTRRLPERTMTDPQISDLPALTWQSGLALLHTCADELIAAACLAIVAAIWYFGGRRPDLAPRALRVAIVAFVGAVATAHAIGAFAVPPGWHAIDGAAKAVTALAAIVVAIALWRTMPVAGSLL